MQQGRRRGAAPSLGSLYPGLAKLMQRAPYAFDMVRSQPDAILQVLAGYDIELDLSDPFQARVFGATVRKDALLAAYKEGRAPSRGHKWLADALLKATSSWRPANLTGFTFRIIPSGDERADAAAQAICDYETIMLEHKHRTEMVLYRNMNEMQALMQALDPLEDRLAQGFRVRHVLSMLGGPGKKPDDTVRTMLRLYAGLPAPSFASREVARTEEMIRVAGLLELDGEPDYVPPDLSPAWSEPENTFALLDDAESSMLIEESVRFFTWRLDNPFLPSIRYPLPYHLSEETLRHLHRCGHISRGLSTDRRLNFFGPFNEQRVWPPITARDPDVWQLTESGAAFLTAARERHRPDIFVAEGGRVLSSSDKSLFSGSIDDMTVSIDAGSDELGPSVVVSARPSDQQGWIRAVFRPRIEDGRLVIDRDPAAGSAEGLSTSQLRALSRAVDDLHAPILCHLQVLAEARAVECRELERIASRTRNGLIGDRNDLERTIGHLQEEIKRIHGRRKIPTSRGERIDTSLGVLRVTLEDAEKQEYRIQNSEAESKRKNEGRLEYEGQSVLVRRDGQPVEPGSLWFTGMKTPQGLWNLETAITRYRLQRPAAVTEVRVDELQRRLADLQPRLEVAEKEMEAAILAHRTAREEVEATNVAARDAGLESNPAP